MKKFQKCLGINWLLLEDDRDLTNFDSNGCEFEREMLELTFGDTVLVPEKHWVAFCRFHSSHRFAVKDVPPFWWLSMSHNGSWYTNYMSYDSVAKRYQGRVVDLLTTREKLWQAMPRLGLILIHDGLMYCHVNTALGIDL